jgi:hypothetical protein
MPILYRDPWRQQFFEHVSCPEGVVVPLKDYDAYESFPESRWAYNKLLIAEKQGLLCAPHGVIPPHFPVFSKPIYNLNTMGADSRILHNLTDYHSHRQAGHMWSELLIGEHISTDVLVLNGNIIWHSHTRGHPLDEGTFDRWDVNVQCNSKLLPFLTSFINQHFPTYTGAMNLETISGKIIEMHLRFADQWPDLYPAGFLDAVVALSSGAFSLDNSLALTPQRMGYSVVLFGRRGRSYWKKPPEYEVQALLRRSDVSSVQLPFHEGQLAEQHSMPPGGFRLAVINGFDLEQCLAAREQLAELFKNVNAFSGSAKVTEKRISLARGVVQTVQISL